MNTEPQLNSSAVAESGGAASSTGPAGAPHRIQPPYYPIVYVRGYAMRAAEREETFYDTYYGFSATSVEKRQAPPGTWFKADVFEGQFIRFMKSHGYRDEVNLGLEDGSGNPSRAIWICRFYDEDYLTERLRSIEQHAADLDRLLTTDIPQRLEACGVDLGPERGDYKVILLAHSMGGLVCRTLIQNILPGRGEDPKRWIYRLVTMGTPHRGIDLGRIPDFLEDFVVSSLNPFDANIFKQERMREYLKLVPEYDLHSLGSEGDPLSFPVKRCLCIIGSDHTAYRVALGLVKEATGNFSDGLVRQDRAYLVAGQAPPAGQTYPPERRAFWANVHRAHSGFRGIVNSYESYENIQRFLFGDTMAEIALEGITLQSELDARQFYDFEFLFSIRNTGTYLHRVQQDPCENAMRFNREELPQRLVLHTGFMNSKYRDPNSPYSRFAMKLRVIEHRLGSKALWDREYPERSIYDETLEMRVGDVVETMGAMRVQYRWLSDTADFVDAVWSDDEAFRVPLRATGAFAGEIAIRVGKWPDPELTRD
ncbi:MAG: esterase/lipase family protein [Gemmatimonadales bacterium]